MPRRQFAKLVRQCNLVTPLRSKAGALHPKLRPLQEAEVDVVHRAEQTRSPTGTFGWSAFLHSLLAISDMAFRRLGHEDERVHVLTQAHLLPHTRALAAAFAYNFAGVARLPPRRRRRGRQLRLRLRRCLPRHQGVLRFHRRLPVRLLLEEQEQRRVHVRQLSRGDGDVPARVAVAV